MGVEDKDFIMRQVKQLAEGLGGFLSKKSVKEFLNYQQNESALLTDAEIEELMLVAEVNIKAKKLQLTK